MITHYLKLNFQVIFTNSNLLTSHILCLNETNVENIHDNQEKKNYWINLKFCPLIVNMEQCFYHKT